MIADASHDLAAHMALLSASLSLSQTHDLRATGRDVAGDSDDDDDDSLQGTLDPHA